MKSKILFIALFFIACSCSVTAQATFQKTYGGNNIGYANVIHQTTDGGFILVGTTNNNGTDSSNVYLIKTNSSGDTVFAKIYGGSGDESGYNVQQTTDGGFIIIGNSDVFGAGLWDIYLIKTNSSGDVLWTKTYGGTDQDYGYSVQQTTDGGYILAGVRNNPFGFDNDLYLIRTNSTGDTLWTKIYGAGNHDEGYSVLQTSDGGFIVAGTTVSFGSGNSDVYLIKTNSDGDTLWTKTYGGTNADYCYEIQKTTDGGYILIGESLSFGAGVWNAYLIKIDGDGTVTWSKTYGGASITYMRSVQQTTDGGYILGGSTNNFGAGGFDMYLVKTDSMGSLLWSKAYGDTLEEHGNYAVQNADGGYTITGYAQSFGAGNINVYLVKTDANGNTDCNQSDAATIESLANTVTGNTMSIVSVPSNVFVTAPATVTHDGGAVTPLCLGSLAEEIKSKKNTINIYPNPSTINESITVNSNASIYEVLIANVLGQIIYQAKPHADNFSFQLDEAGIYFVRLKTNDSSFVEKIIVAK